MQAPGLRQLCEIRAELGAPIEKGGGPGGRWRIIPIIGGVVEGSAFPGASSISARTGRASMTPVMRSSIPATSSKPMTGR